MFNHKRFHFLIFVVEPFSLRPENRSQSLLLLGWEFGAAADRAEWGPLAGGTGARLSLLCLGGPWGQSPALGGRVWSGPGVRSWAALRGNGHLWSP